MERGARRVAPVEVAPQRLERCLADARIGILEDGVEHLLDLLPSPAEDRERLAPHLGVGEERGRSRVDGRGELEDGLLGRQLGCGPPVARAEEDAPELVLPLPRLGREERERVIRGGRHRVRRERPAEVDPGRGSHAPEPADERPARVGVGLARERRGEAQHLGPRHVEPGDERREVTLQVVVPVAHDLLERVGERRARPCLEVGGRDEPLELRVLLLERAGGGVDRLGERLEALLRGSLRRVPGRGWSRRRVRRARLLGGTGARLLELGVRAEGLDAPVGPERVPGDSSVRVAVGHGVPDDEVVVGRARPDHGEARVDRVALAAEERAAQDGVPSPVLLGEVADPLGERLPRARRESPLRGAGLADPLAERLEVRAAALGEVLADLVALLRPVDEEVEADHARPDDEGRDGHEPRGPEARLEGLPRGGRELLDRVVPREREEHGEGSHDQAGDRDEGELAERLDPAHALVLRALARERLRLHAPLGPGTRLGIAEVEAAPDADHDRRVVAEPAARAAPERRDDARLAQGLELEGPLPYRELRLRLLVVRVVARAQERDHHPGAHVAPHRDDGPAAAALELAPLLLGGEHVDAATFAGDFDRRH